MEEVECEKVFREGRWDQGGGVHAKGVCELQQEEGQAQQDPMPGSRSCGQVWLAERTPNREKQEVSLETKLEIKF